jgi:hypothetical protein
MLRAGFLVGLAQRAFGHVLSPSSMKPAGSVHRPRAARCCAAQQHLLAPHRHRADHVDRVLVVDLAAGGADRALAVVVGGTR